MDASRKLALLPCLRSASSRPTSQALHHTRVARMATLDATSSDAPSAVPYSPTRCPSSLNQPSTGGTRTTAGNSLRAMAPPAPPLFTSSMIPRSGLAQSAPTASTTNVRAVCRAIDICEAAYSALAP